MAGSETVKLSSMTPTDDGVTAEIEPGPIWGGWWLWEPPLGVEPRRAAANKDEEHD
jgi:hypothetical protein